MTLDLEGRSLYQALYEIHAKGLTGRLHVYHWDGKEGIVGINGGQVVHCQYHTLRGEKAFNILKNWVSISLGFYENVENLSVDMEHNTESLLVSLEERDREIGRLRRSIPGPQAIFVLSPESPEEKIVFHQKIWKVLSLLNGRNTVKDICVALKANEFSVLRVLDFLLKRKVIRLAASEKTLPPSTRDHLFQELENHLAEFIGPIATVVIEDTLGEMGKSREFITRNDLPLLVERVSENVDDERERVQFQSRMLALIQKIPEEKEEA